jgi:hypothetical protein
MSSGISKWLILVHIEQSSLMEILTTNTVAGPRYSVEPLIGKGFAAMYTLGIFSPVYSLQRLINQIQESAIIVRH